MAKKNVGRPRVADSVIRKDGLTEGQMKWLTTEAKRQGVSRFILIRTAVDLLIEKSEEETMKVA